MRIDYLTLLLVNMVAGHIIAAGYVVFGMLQPPEAQRRWAPPLAMVGVVALLGGLHMALTWPLPEKVLMYNALFGEMTVLLGIVFLGAAAAVWRGWDLTGVLVYATVAGLTAVVIAARILNLQYGYNPPRPVTKGPLMTAAGYIISGLSPLAALAAWRLRTKGSVRALAAVILLAGAAIWALTAGGAYWAHMDLWYGK